MSTKVTKKASGARKPSASEHEAWRVALQAYRESLHRLNAAIRLARGERDDLPRVKIPAPVVKPKGVQQDRIRKAVRKAVQEYSARHSKALGRS
jgi:hypothetical protein